MRPLHINFTCTGRGFAPRGWGTANCYAGPFPLISTKAWANALSLVLMASEVRRRLICPMVPPDDSNRTANIDLHQCLRADLAAHCVVGAWHRATAFSPLVKPDRLIPRGRRIWHEMYEFGFALAGWGAAFVFGLLRRHFDRCATARLALGGEKHQR